MQNRYDQIKGWTRQLQNFKASEKWIFTYTQSIYLQINDNNLQRRLYKFEEIFKKEILKMKVNI